MTLLPDCCIPCQSAKLWAADSDSIVLAESNVGFCPVNLVNEDAGRIVTIVILVSFKGLNEPRLFIDRHRMIGTQFWQSPIHQCSDGALLRTLYVCWPCRAPLGAHKAD